MSDAVHRTTACRLGRRLLFGAFIWLAASAGASAEEAPSIVYKVVEGRELRLFIDTPPGRAPEGGRPAVVYFHGGGWVQGTPKHLMRYSRHLAQLGVTGIRVEYRLLERKRPQAPEPCIQDAKSALRYVRARAAELDVDPRRIAAAGGSAGGHLAAFAALV